MRVATRPMDGTAEAWDPANPEPFRALAGSQFLGADGDTAKVRTRGGRVEHAGPGWLVIRPDGCGEVILAAPENLGGEYSVWGEAVPL